MSNYIRRFWKARAGTNLNKFTKSSETASSVILENAPDAITEAGTPFTADAENNLEIGVCQALSEARGLTAGLSRQFVAIDQTVRDWGGIAAAPNGDVYAGVYNGDIYKQTGGAGDFVALGQTARYWRGIAAAPNGDIYACVANGYIYRHQFTLSPSSCASASVTTADVTITENRDGTLILSGALTGDRTLYLPAAVWKKTIICDCTGSYYVRVLAAGQTTGGVYLAPGDAADAYCDGTAVNMLKHLRSKTQIELSLSAAFSLPANTITTLTGFTVAGAARAEFDAARGVFTAKNSGWYRVSGVGMFNGSALTGTFNIRAIRASDGKTFYDSLYTGSTGYVIINPSSMMYLAAGDSLTLRAETGAGTSITLTTSTRIYINPVI